jgi:hypothetical protein
MSGLNQEVLNWLLSPEDPGVRYLAMRDLLDYPEDDPEMKLARRQAHEKGPIATILKEMDPQGYWVAAGPGYLPKYRSTVWSVILLALLGASVVEDDRIARACGYLLENALTPRGQFTISGTPSGSVDCLQGNLCWSLLEVGCTDERLENAFEWMARSVTGEGVESVSSKQAEVRYYAGKCGPDFACGANDKQSCAWGGVRVMLAFSSLPEGRRTPLIQRAIQRGVDFFFSVDPASAGYPSGYMAKPSTNWWKFGFPLFYVSDILQIVEVLVRFGYGSDPRLRNALDLVRSKQDEQGRWLLEYDYTGKTFVDFGPKKVANKWVTLRALRVLKQVD